MMKRYLTIIVICLLLGCKEPMDKNFITVKDDYKIGFVESANDNLFVKHNENIGMMSVIVHKKIKRIGFNDRFAIIERVGNYNDLGSTALDTLVVRYYIIDMTRNFNELDKEFLFGPVTNNEFVARKEELGIAKLDFTMEYKVN
jgi:hypothetical protein